MVVTPSDYDLFYKKLCEAFLEKTLLGKLPAGAQSIYSRKIWQKTINGKKIAAELFKGSTTSNPEYFYRMKTALTKAPYTEIDPVAMCKALAYLGFELPEEYNKSSPDEKALYLFASFLTSKPKKESAPQITPLPASADDVKKIVEEFFIDLNAGRYTKAWEFVKNASVEHPLSFMDGYDDFELLFASRIRNVFIFNCRYDDDRSVCSWEVFFEKQPLDGDTFYHKLKYWDGSLQEFDMIIAALDAVYQRSPSYRKWSSFNYEDFMEMWEASRFSRFNIESYITRIKHYYMKMFAKFIFKKVKNDWIVAKLEIQPALTKRFEIW